MSVDDLPRPSAKMIKQARKKMKDMRVIVDVAEKDSRDKSAYEGDEICQFVFNKRKFLNSLGTVRINELVKEHSLYVQGMDKRSKIDALSSLPNIDDVIFYEIYLHKYGSDKAFADAINKIPKPKKRGRKKKSST